MTHTDRWVDRHQHLPDEPAARELLLPARRPRVAAAIPTSCLAWAELAEDGAGRWRDDRGVRHARTGYHRGLDALRRNGWKGHGPVPWEHGPNQRVPAALNALGLRRRADQETAEAERCRAFLADCSRRRSACSDRWSRRMREVAASAPRTTVDEARNRPLPRFRTSSADSMPGLVISCVLIVPVTATCHPVVR